MGKCRNSPIKRLTVHRHELLASVMAVRLSNLVLSEIDWNIDRVIFWSDSTTVLQYIKNESRRFHRFVATRLEEIQLLPKSLNAISFIDKNKVSSLPIFEIIFTSEKYIGL